MAKDIFDGSSIVHLSLKQASTLHPIWKDKDLDIPLDAISPNDLVSLLGADDDDTWIEWLVLSHPIILVEKQLRNRPGDDKPEMQYLRIMGHSTFNYLTRYLGGKYGSDVLNKKRYPMTVIPQKKLSSLKKQIFNTELVFSFILQKSKAHIGLMREHVLSSPTPIPKISTYRQLSKLAKVSHSSLFKPKHQEE